MVAYVPFRSIPGIGDQRFSSWKRANKAKSILEKLSQDLKAEILGETQIGSPLVVYAPSRAGKVYVRTELVPYIEQWANSFSSALPDHIYLLKAKRTFSYKIGITNDIAKRVKAIESNSPVPIKVEFCIRHPRAKEVEKVLHLKYAKYRIHHEWFTFDRFVRYQVDQDFANLDSLIPLEVS